jgi:hypothetical protein
VTAEQNILLKNEILSAVHSSDWLKKQIYGKPKYPNPTRTSGQSAANPNATRRASSVQGIPGILEESWDHPQGTDQACGTATPGTASRACG